MISKLSPENIVIDNEFLSSVSSCTYNQREIMDVILIFFIYRVNHLMFFTSCCLFSINFVTSNMLRVFDKNTKFILIPMKLMNERFQFC